MDIQMGSVVNYVLGETSGKKAMALKTENTQNRHEKTAFDSKSDSNKEQELLIVEKKTADLPEALKDLERISLAFNKKLKFRVDRDSHELIVKVIDADTDKVVRELPSVEFQRLRDRIRETLGILFDEQV